MPQCPNIFFRLFSQRKIPLGRSWIGFQKLLGDIFPLASFFYSPQKNMMQVNIFFCDSSRDLSDLNISYQLPPKWHIKYQKLLFGRVWYCSRIIQVLLLDGLDFDGKCTFSFSLQAFQVSRSNLWTWARYFKVIESRLMKWLVSSQLQERQSLCQVLVLFVYEPNSKQTKQPTD